MSGTEVRAQIDLQTGVLLGDSDARNELARRSGIEWSNHVRQAVLDHDAEMGAFRECPRFFLPIRMVQITFPRLHC